MTFILITAYTDAAAVKIQLLLEAIWESLQCEHTASIATEKLARVLLHQTDTAPLSSKLGNECVSLCLPDTASSSHV